jgi:large subunit ribosomal protein L9
MEVILLEKVGRVGNVGDKINVKSGYARNFLFPFAKAIPATRENLANFEARKAELVKIAADKLSAAQARADKLNGLVISIEANAGEEGKLFGSVGTRDIAEAVTTAGHALEKSEVLLPMGALREAGEYEINLSLGSEVIATIKLTIVGVQ